MSDLLPSLPSNARWTGAPETVPVTPDWRQEAACKGLDPDLWYPERGDLLVMAREVCARCPVRGECLDFALTEGEKFGVWGGMSERERRILRAKRRPGSPTATDERRRQVVAMSRELTNAEIARDLGLSTRTVSRYLEKGAR